MRKWQRGTPVVRAYRRTRAEFPNDDSWGLAVVFYAQGDEYALMWWLGSWSLDLTWPRRCFRPFQAGRESRGAFLWRSVMDGWAFGFGVIRLDGLWDAHVGPWSVELGPRSSSPLGGGRGVTG